MFVKGTTSGLNGNFRLSFTPKSIKDFLLIISYIGSMVLVEWLEHKKKKKEANFNYDGIGIFNPFPVFI